MKLFMQMQMFAICNTYHLKPQLMYLISLKDLFTISMMPDRPIYGSLHFAEANIVLF